MVLRRASTHELRHARHGACPLVHKKAETRFHRSRMVGLMPLTLSALIVAATMPAPQQSVASAQPTEPIAAIRRSAPPMSEKDSVRALKFARRAQSDFEVAASSAVADRRLAGRRLRRRDRTLLLSRADGIRPSGGGAGGHRCAHRLLTVLDSLGRLLPGDRWILGQKLRYYLEEGRAKYC